MVRMFEKVVQWVKAGGADMEARYKQKRLNKIVDSSKDIGYGYHDDLDYFYHSVFSGKGVNPELEKITSLSIQNLSLLRG